MIFWLVAKEQYQIMDIYTQSLTTRHSGNLRPFFIFYWPSVLHTLCCGIWSTLYCDYMSDFVSSRSEEWIVENKKRVVDRSAMCFLTYSTGQYLEINILKTVYSNIYQVGCKDQKSVFKCNKKIPRRYRAWLAITIRSTGKDSMHSGFFRPIGQTSL